MARKSRPRERVDYPTHKRYVRRNDRGEFTSEQVSVGRSLRRDRQQPARRTVEPGFGDRGDQRHRTRRLPRRTSR